MFLNTKKIEEIIQRKLEIPKGKINIVKEITVNKQK